jgi:recombination protein U
MDARSISRNASYANRGMPFQDEINAVNEGYELMRVASVYEVPTPCKIVNIKGKPTIIRQKSIVDYLGTWQGRALAIEAKSTHEPSWALSNLQQHQLDFLVRWERCGGIAGVLLRFETVRRTYWIPLAEMQHYIERAIWGGRKSISMAELPERLLVKTTKRCSLDYLATIEKVAAEAEQRRRLSHELD